MSTIVHTGGGAKVTMLASLTSIPTSSTAVSGAEKWKEYDAILYITQFSVNGTYIEGINFTKDITAGESHVGVSYGSQCDVTVTYGGNSLSVKKMENGVTLSTLKIYGINF